MTMETSWNVPTPSALPPNWGQCTDEQGNIYYYNYVTGLTSWDVPGDAMAQPSTKPLPSEATVQVLKAIQV